MRVTISTVEFDPLGVVELDAEQDSEFGEARRRVNRIATLDGGVVFNDQGYTEADKTIRLTFRIESKAQDTALARLLRLYQMIQVALPTGVFLAAPEVYTASEGQGTLSLLVKQKLSGD